MLAELSEKKPLEIVVLKSPIYSRRARNQFASQERVVDRVKAEEEERA